MALHPARVTPQAEIAEAMPDFVSRQEGFAGSVKALHTALEGEHGVERPAV